MSHLAMLQSLTGEWSGTSKLWLSPAEPPRSCITHATVAEVATGKFVRIDYTWEYEGKPQAGSLLCGYDSKQRKATAVWVDGWHMGDKYMPCDGTVDESHIDVRGSYEAPPGPDWGWRTVVECESGESFRLIMYNISPDGNEELAVEAAYRRT